MEAGEGEGTGGRGGGGGGYLELTTPTKENEEGGDPVKILCSGRQKR